MENVNVAKGGAVEGGEFLAVVYAAGYVEPGVGAGGGGEGADEAECLVEAAVGVLVSSTYVMGCSSWKTSWFLSFLELLRINVGKCCLTRCMLLISVHS